MSVCVCVVLGTAITGIDLCAHHTIATWSFSVTAKELPLCSLHSCPHPPPPHSSATAKLLSISDLAFRGLTF